MNLEDVTTEVPLVEDRKLRFAGLRLGRLSRQLGLLVVAVGLVVIGLGWSGAAGGGGEIHHVPVVQAQLPYLLSGGFLGLAIVVFGAALIIADSHRQSQSRLIDRLEALIESVQPQGNNDTDEVGAGGAVIAGTASYHLPGCRLAKGRHEARLVSLAVAVGEGLTPCRVCRPPEMRDTA